jgi:hypothetical protein
MMTDTNRFAEKESFSVNTDGLGSVVLVAQGLAKPNYMTSDEARNLARHLTEMANDADWQNTSL